MREKDVVQLVDAWMGILEGVKSGSISNDIGEVCLEVVGQYVEWIDINLVGIRSHILLAIYGASLIL